MSRDVVVGKGRTVAIVVCDTPYSAALGYAAANCCNGIVHEYPDEYCKERLLRAEIDKGGTRANYFFGTHKREDLPGCNFNGYERVAVAGFIMQGQDEGIVEPLMDAFLQYTGSKEIDCSGYLELVKSGA